MQEKMKLSTSLQEVSQFTTSLDTKLSGLDTETRTLVVLGIQELLVNIVEHAFANDSGTIEIEISISGSDLYIAVSDNAKQGFNTPDEVTLPDPLDLSEGGMGLFIIYQSFDQVGYERLSDGNVWRLSKRLGQIK